MTVTTFISEFLNQFFIQGLFGIFKGIGLGIANMFKNEADELRYMVMMDKIISKGIDAVKEGH